MKKIVYSILLLVATFLLNIGLYYYSDSYSFFLKKVKYGDEIITLESKNITDNIGKENCNCEAITQCNAPQETNTWSLVSTGVDLLKKEEQLNSFFSIFDKNTLSEKTYDEYYQIFDITDEYPKEYLTYHNENYEVYLFLWGSFIDIYNLFDLLSTYPNVEKKFSLNKLNNFWKQSFFINTKVDDGNVRLVVDNWKILFWLKVKKSYYNNVKTILEKF